MKKNLLMIARSDAAARPGLKGILTKALTVLCLWLGIMAGVHAQAPSVTTSKLYGGTQAEGLGSTPGIGHMTSQGFPRIIKTSDGGYLIATVSASIDYDVANCGAHGRMDAWLIKMAADGTIQWKRCYGGGGNDNVISIIQLSDGGYAFTGYTHSSGTGDVPTNSFISSPGDAAMWVVRLNAPANATTAPTVMWSKCFGTSGDNRGQSILQSTDGSLIVGGYISSSIYPGDGYVAGSYGFNAAMLSINASTGALNWNKCYGSDTQIFDIVQNPDNTYAFLGTHVLDSYNRCYRVVQLGSGNSPSITWSYQFTYRNMVQVGLINRLSDGSYMIMASERLGTIMRGFVADVAAPGTLKWSGYYGANNADNAGTVLFGMIKDPDPTKCIMVGFSNSQNNFPDGDITDHKYSYNSYGDNSYDTNHLGLNLDGWAMKIDPSVIVADPNNGNALRPKLVWQKCYGSSYSDQFTGIVPSGSGYVVVGYTTNPNNTNSTYYGDIPAKIYQSGQAGAPQYRDIPDIWLAGLGPTSLTCTAGSTAPSLNGTSVTNSCPTTTVNLSSLYTGTPPSGTSLVWFNNSNHTGTAVSNPAAAPTGQTYYAFFYDNISDCYSPASQAVTANPSPCAAASVDCPKTQVSPAPVQGTPNQMFLIVTANVTTAGSFPVSVSGSGFSLYNGVTSVSTTTTGVQTFKIPVQYDGSALGTLTFSLGSNTCTANLSQNEVVNTNCNTWTLDKCTPQVVPPVLK